MDHSDILHREFDRIADETDLAYTVMKSGNESRGEAVYKEWASLLLRYHDAIERVSGNEPSEPPASMKGALDDVSETREVSATNDIRSRPDVDATARESKEG